MTSKHAQERLKILGFFADHGEAATCDAFGLSCRTLYRWKQTLRQAGGNPAALTAKPCAPRRRRQPQAPPALIKEIRRLRKQFPNIGKAKLQVMLQPWCRQQDIALPSASTLGRIIARDPNKMRHTPARLDARGRHKLIARKRKTRKPKGVKHQPLEVFACDTVVRLRDGLRRCLFTFIDPQSRFAIAFAATTQSSRQASIALDALCELLPQPPKYLLSDNGSEFMGDFHKQLEQHGITHWRTYPRSPKMNAHVERSTAPSKSSLLTITRTNCSMTWPALTENWPTGCSTATPSCPIIASACDLLQLPHPQSTTVPKVVDLYTPLYRGNEPTYYNAGCTASLTLLNSTSKCSSIVLEETICGNIVAFSIQQSRRSASPATPLSAQSCARPPSVRNAVTEGLAPHINQVHAITYDNGREFSYHASMARDLEARIYFAHPYTSWQRGLNENTNGLIRQYFPKQRELTTVRNAEIKHAMDKLNHRPRKTLGFRTPHEVFFNAKTSLTVALTS